MLNKKRSLYSKNPPLKLFDSYRREVYDFVPLTAQRVSLYACGPTVYDYAHIGNLRTYLFVDILRRTLAANGYTVKHVMNITDVGHLTSDADQGEDKMLKGARKQGKSAWEIAQYFEQAFLKDLTKLAISEPTVLCRATEHISEQIDYIGALQAQGFTYQTADGVYFDSQKLASYGYLARLKAEGLQRGKRVDMADKKYHTDFALWKFSDQSDPQQVRQMQWSSPWGVGFPGWHIECSAMSEKYLGKEFDIHVGGEDHISVHHTNEIAQCEGRHGKQPATFWMHGYFLQMSGEKLSKSGRSVLLSDLEAQGFSALAFRYLVLTSHYRAHLQFSVAALQSASIALERLRKLMAQWRVTSQAQSAKKRTDNVDLVYLDRFMTAINNDLNTPQALAVLWSLAKSELSALVKHATVLVFDQVLSLALDQEVSKVQIPESVIELAQRRQRARTASNWALSDDLREQIAKAGYNIKDSSQGFELTAV